MALRKDLPAPPPGFTIEGSDVPPPPPGFQIEGSSSPSPPAGFQVEAPAKARAVPPLIGTDSIVRPIDGDTARLSSGRNLRLWGVDAPEMKQQGWDRQGNPVLIGVQSRDALGAMLDVGPTTIGDPVSESYGRPVASVNVDGRDAGLALARDGSVLAAPEYLAADPQRRFEYMQAERLARLNGLGVHDTYSQMPSDFRHNPEPAPDRETVARFWDTPTPFAGMRPEDEKRYIELLQTAKSPDEIVSFVRTVGFNIDPDDAARWIASRDKDRAQDRDPNAYAVYRDQPKALTDQGDGAAGAAGRGLGTGVLAGGLDEAGALVDTLGLTDGRENLFNSDRRFADIWANNQEQNSSILGYDDLAHPYAQTAGELAGGLVVPFGAEAKTAAELARVGAIYGGVSGFLGTDGSASERAASGAMGVPIGAALGAGTGKLLQYLAPRAKGLVDRFTSGRRGSAETGAVAGEVAGDAVSAARLPDNIDMADVPPPPPGFVIDEPVPASSPEFAVDAADTPVRQGEAMAMDTERMPSISEDSPQFREQYARTREGQGDQLAQMDQPLTDAQRTVMAERIDPRDLTPIPSNEIGSVEEAAARDAGRYAPAKVPNERGELTRQTVRAYNGAEVPKVGPIDLVGFVRLRGGLADQVGELSHMGLTNSARRGMDFVGQEQRFGPLVNEQGARLDDAAEAAWEAGYFPDHTERPTTAEFLDALRDTHEGRNRHFLPEDYAEIDRYEAAQAARYALEQQRFETGQPVYRDKSVPADEGQPFPPPEAYDEWGMGGGPDFAGNIRLEKLDTPQEISRALSTIDKRVGFDAATRGRVSQAETERLAADLNMTPEALIARRKGQSFNAEEALAARQILAKSSNELVNAAKRIKALEDPGDELLAAFRQKLVRHVAIQEQVSGMTAEAGRALGQFRMMASSNAVRGDVLSAMVKGGGGKRTLQDAANVLLDAVEMEPGKFNALADKAVKAKWSNRLSELYINFLLSWPQTHAVNITSNTLTSLGQLPEHAAASLVGRGREIIAGKNVDRITATEVGQRTFGLIQGAREGAAMFARALRTGEPSDFISKVEGQEYKAIPGKLGEVVRVPTRLLTAEDELFKGIARRMELNGIAARIAHKEGLKGTAAKERIAQLASEPTDAMLQGAEDYARYITFQSKLGETGQGISNLSNQNMIAKLFVPFVRTPINLLKFATERSPAAPALAEWRKDFVAGGARRDLAVAKMLVGSGFGAAMYQGALEGKITGAAPSDPKKSRLLYADGWKPYSFKVGDTYYSYARLDPFSTTIGVAADLALLPQGMSKRQAEDKQTLLVASIMGNLANKTWLSGISDVVGALHDPERNADNMMQRLVGSLLIPNVVAGTARTVDPVQREVETVGDALKNRIPGQREGLLPRRDIWGKVIKSEGGIGPDALSPMAVSTALNDPVNKALLELDYAPGYPSDKGMTAEQFDRLLAMAGSRSHEALTSLVTSPAWASMDDDAKGTAAEKIVRDARKGAKAELFGTSAPRGDKTGAAPATSTSTDAVAEAGGSAGLNVYRDIQVAIPGIRITSGFRTPEYQADMRRRGYTPAANSAHLDGSALDLLPPPGKSMNWLGAQVRKQFPNAKLLPEGDHLHAIFPGYYGAPVLGGARSAGLANPLEGMPPPPPGFTLQ